MGDTVLFIATIAICLVTSSVFAADGPPSETPPAKDCAADDWICKALRSDGPGSNTGNSSGAILQRIPPGLGSNSGIGGGLNTLKRFDRIDPK